MLFVPREKAAFSSGKFYLVGSSVEWSAGDIFAGFLLWIGKTGIEPDRLRELDGKVVRVTGVFSLGTNGPHEEAGHIVWTVNTAHSNGAVDAESVEEAANNVRQIDMIRVSPSTSVTYPARAASSPSVVEI